MKRETATQRLLFSQAKQKQLAKWAGVCPRTIRYRKQKPGLMSVGELAGMAYHLELTPEELYEIVMEQR